MSYSLAVSSPIVEFFEDVVKAGEGQAVARLLAFAMGVEVLGKLADGIFLRIVAKRKRERIEAARIVLTRVVAHAEAATCRERTHDVNPAAQYAEVKGIIKCKNIKLVREIFSY